MIPRWLRLLERLLIPAQDREFVEGDLREEYVRLSRQHGYLRSTMAFVGELLFLRRQQTVGALRTFGSDLAYTIRALRAHPTFTIAATLTLGLGIGVTTTIFSIADAVLLRPLPYRDADRLLFVSSSFPGSSGGGDQLSYLDIRAIAERATRLEGIAAYHTGRALELGHAATPERVRANFIQPHYLELLGARAAIGRLFAGTEGIVVGQHPLAVVSHRFWTSHLRSDPGVVGRPIVLSDIALTVIGVLEPSFQDVSAEEGHSFDSDVFIPATMLDAFGGRGLLTDPQARNFWAIARVAPRVSVQEATEEIASIGDTLAAELAANRGFTFWGARLDRHLARDIRGPIWLLLAGSAFVLLVACANVANLLLVHLTSRTRELAIRQAIGASRGQLVRLVALEASLVAGVGGLFGAAIAWLSNDLVRWYVPGEITPRLAAATITPRVLGFSLLLAGAVALTLAVFAALRIGRRALQSHMRDGGRTTDVRGRRIRRGLLVVEVAMSLMLVLGAHLMLDSFTRLQASGIGFRTERLITFALDLRAARFADPARVLQFDDELLAALAATPGIDAAMLWGPGRPGRNTWVTFPGREDAPTGAERLMSWRHTITPGALGALGIPILSGREFDRRDTRESPPVVIVSETLARTLWPGQDAVGQRLRWRTDVAGSPLLSVVGVAADAKHRGRLNHVLHPPRDLYVPYSQRVERSVVVVVRASDDVAAALGSIRPAVARLDPNLPVFNLQPMAAHLGEEEAETRFAALLLSAYASLALALAALGIYGVLSYHVSMRARELAVRRALGARGVDVVRLVLADGTVPTMLGIAAGLIGGLTTGRLLRSLLFEVRADDPWRFVSVAAVLLGVALAAAAIPSAMALRAEPIRALRQD